ncbi:DUF4296 domain-containing protein [Mucilaginibacter sp. PAMB04274]|uniref:DUF4296 domain-containing protein n=1 Tax=Mucilaginibacter sp. PAMB04274 TaxID=3138568 RepID=UPI0031F6FFF5
MHLYKNLFFLVAIFFVSCGDDVPKGILTHQQMAGVLVDVHIIDGSLMEIAQQPDTLYKYSANRYLQVFKQHDTDSAQFRKSFSYYANKPDQLFDIYEKVLPIIKAKSDSATKVKVRADSLERIRQNKINEKIAKRVADSVARLNKDKADSVAKIKKMPKQHIKKAQAGQGKLL